MTDKGTVKSITHVQGERGGKPVDEVQTVYAADGLEGSGPSDFDVAQAVQPLKLVKIGLAVMLNEMSRLVAKSKSTGLTLSQSAILEKYVRLSCDIAKKHSRLNINYIDDKDAATMSSEQIAERMLMAAITAGVDLSKINIESKRHKKVVHEN